MLDYQHRVLWSKVFRKVHALGFGHTVLGVLGSGLEPWFTGGFSDSSSSSFVSSVN